MDVFSYVLLIILFLKVTTVTKTIIWLKANKNGGRDYIAKIPNDLVINRKIKKEHVEYLNNCAAGFFPFGFKDYRLQAEIKRLKSFPIFSLNYFLYWLELIFQSLFYRFHRLTYICLTNIFIVVVFDKIHINCLFFDQIPLFYFVLLPLSVMLFIVNMLISIEAAFSYGVFKNYAVRFHQQSRASWGDSLLLTELKVIIGMGISTVLASGVIVFVCALYHNSFPNISLPHAPVLLDFLRVFIASYYFAVTTLLTVGFGDIYPKGIIGEVVTLLIMLQSFALISIVIGAFYASQSAKENG